MMDIRAPKQLLQEKKNHPTHSSRNRTFVVSPVINGHRMVTFRFLAPKAGEVLLKGSFLSGDDNPPQQPRGKRTIDKGSRIVG